EGGFREDLYYRLNVFPVEVPSLRGRKDDIPALVRHFINRFNAQEGKSIRDASPETYALLSAFDWPGNVRQLENSVFRAVILCDGDLLGPEDFPQISGLTPSMDVEVSGASEAMSDVYAAIPGAESDADIGPVDIMDEQGHLRSLENIERDLIEFAIENYAGRMSEVARRLGVGRSTLYRKVREYDLDVDQVRAAS
ncbi:MAG: helix-turn-helix domain-containing protein, partial [Maricaulis sp.]|nr:helix-turn-helix domain-containing protein [Maricaulis sp.]